MLKKVLSHRFTKVLALVFVCGGLLFMGRRDSSAAEKARKGWLGVSVQELTPSLREAMKVGKRTGLLITDVVRNSPADDADLREEDVLLSFDGEAVEKAADFTQLVRNTPTGKKVKVKILRDGEERELEVTIGARKSDSLARSFAWSGDAGHSPNVMVWGNRPRLGVQIQELNKDLAPYFKVEEKNGVLVLSVSASSPAEKAGLKAGDVITRVSDEKITDYDDLVHALQGYEEGDKVSIEYVRQGKSATVEAELENNNSHGFRFYAPDREQIRLPLQNKIRIQRFDGGESGELEILMPELHRDLEGLRKGMIERGIQDRLRNELKRLPKGTDIDNLRTI